MNNRTPEEVPRRSMDKTKCQRAWSCSGAWLYVNTSRTSDYIVHAEERHCNKKIDSQSFTSQLKAKLVVAPTHHPPKATRLKYRKEILPEGGWGLPAKAVGGKSHSI